MIISALFDRESAVLVNETGALLHVADLDDVATELSTRLFGTGRMFELRDFIYHLTPRGELVLRDVIDIATRSAWPAAMKRRAIDNALSFAGFERKDTTA